MTLMTMTDNYYYWPINEYCIINEDNEDVWTINIIVWIWRMTMTILLIRPIQWKY